MDKSKILESRIRELDRFLDIEKKHNMESVKQIYKRDRKIKELTIEAEDYKEKFKDVQCQVQDLESELKIYKRKLEDAQEICNQNVNRFRKAQQKYTDECGKTEDFEEQIRRRRAVVQKTPQFFQV